MADACLFVMENVDMAGGSPDSYREQVAGGDLPSAVHFLNVGTGRDLTIRELAEVVKRIVGFMGNLVWDSSKPDGMYKKQLDVSRLNALGWKEKIALEEGIERVYRGYGTT